MPQHTYTYDPQPTGRTDGSVHHTVDKHTDGKWQWSYSLPSKEAALRFCKENEGKDLVYPNLR